MRKQHQIYNSEPLLKHPVRLLKDVLAGVRDGWDLAVSHFFAHFKVMHRKYFIGLLWQVAFPIFTASIFIVLRSNAIVSLDSGNLPYPLYVITGVFMWQIFAQSIFSGLTLASSFIRLSSAIKIPPEALWIHVLLNCALIALVNFLMLVLFLVIFSAPISFLAIIMALLFALMLMLLGVSICFLALPIGYIYQDSMRILRLGVSLSFVITPIVYSDAKFPILEVISQLNPITHLVNGARLFLIGGDYNLLPVVWISLGIVAAILPVLMFLKISMPHVTERVV